MPFDPETGEPIEDDERPSLGERIGAKTSYPSIPKPAASAPVAEPNQPIQLDPAKMPDIMAGVSSQMPPRPPVGSNNPNLPDLLKQQADYGKPLDRGAVDPKTGRPMYKIGLGGKIAGTAANFLSGFGGRGPVAYVGPGATNQRYDIDEARREQNLANVGTQIAGQEALDKENTKAFEDLTRQAYQTEIGGARSETAAARTSEADTKGQLADITGKYRESQEELNKARAGKLGEPVEPKTEAEIAIAYQNALLKGDKPSAAKYKGAMDMLARQKAAGKDTSASDLAKTLQVAEKRTAATEKLNNEMEEMRQKRIKENDKVIGFNFPGPKRDAILSKIEQDVAAEKQKRLDAINQEHDAMLGLTKQGPKLQTKNANSKPITIDEAKAYLKRAGGDKDKARKLAKADGRTF